MVEPTKRKPRSRSDWLNASDSGVRAGTSAIERGRFTSGLPPTKLQA